MIVCFGVNINLVVQNALLLDMGIKRENIELENKVEHGGKWGNADNNRWVSMRR